MFCRRAIIGGTTVESRPVGSRFKSARTLEYQFLNWRLPMASFRFYLVALFTLSGWSLFSANAFSAESPSPAKVTVYPLVKEGYDELQKGSYMDAVQSLCQAVILDRDDVSARRYLALALIKADNADRALEQMGLVGRLAQPSAFDYF